MHVIGSTAFKLILVVTDTQYDMPVIDGITLIRVATDKHYDILF